MLFRSQNSAYKRITLVVLVLTVAIFGFKLSVNPIVFNTAYKIDRTWTALDENKQTVDTTFLKSTTHRSEDIPNPVSKDYSKVNDVSTVQNAEVDRVTKKSSQEVLTPRTFKSQLVTKKNSLNISTVKISTPSSKTPVFINATSPRLHDRAPVKVNGNAKVPHPTIEDTMKISSGNYTVQDLMAVKPLNFLRNYKNPCWAQKPEYKTQPAIQCLPYFYLVGAPKSGTTNLHQRLIKHPDISRLAVKEPHWLTRKHYYSSSSKNASALEHYTKMFQFATKEIILKKDDNGFHNMVFGDSSASTLWDNDYWTVLPQFKGLTEPTYTNPDYIHHLNPNAKIMAILRNPVDRLYSDYLYFQHRSAEQFHTNVIRIINDTHECLKSNSLRHCLYTPPQHYSTVWNVRLRIGVYHQHLKEYFRVFPRKQIMVIKLEDFSNNTESYMKKVFEFLELPEVKNEVLVKIADPDKHANSRRPKDKKAGEMLPETRKLLNEFYRPHNDQLTKLLGEKFDYNQDSVR